MLSVSPTLLAVLVLLDDEKAENEVSITEIEVQAVAAAGKKKGKKGKKGKKK